MKLTEIMIAILFFGALLAKVITDVKPETRDLMAGGAYLVGMWAFFIVTLSIALRFVFGGSSKKTSRVIERKETLPEIDANAKINVKQFKIDNVILLIFTRFFVLALGFLAIYLIFNVVWLYNLVNIEVAPIFANNLFEQAFGFDLFGFVVSQLVAMIIISIPAFLSSYISMKVSNFQFYFNNHQPKH